MAPLATAATFTTTVTVDSAVVATSTGRSVGADMALTVTSRAATVDYVVVGANAWARKQGGTWVLVAANQAPSSPMAVLAAPTTLAMATRTGGSPGTSTALQSAMPSGVVTTVLDATYPAAALGLTGDPVAVKITIDGSVVTFQYAGESGGHRTTSVTALKPGSSTPAIVVPRP